MAKYPFRLWFIVLPLLFVGCENLEHRAPQVSDGTAQLQRGRSLYIVQCAACHSVRPVRDYSLVQWKTLVPEMSIEAKLSADEQADLHAYIRAVHATATDP